MTRHEARYKMHENGIGNYSSDVIDQIYDELEKQVCEECANYEPKHGDCFILPIDINVMPKSFGCNQFEGKIK